MNYTEDNNMLTEKLKNTLFQHGKLVIGLDFDDTVKGYADPDLDCSVVIDLMKQCSKLGFDICLWTVITPGGMTLKDKVNYCKLCGINITHINSSPFDEISRFKNNRKPFFNLLLDDSAGLGSACDALTRAIEHL